MWLQYQCWRKLGSQVKLGNFFTTFIDVIRFLKVILSVTVVPRSQSKLVGADLDSSNFVELIAIKQGEISYKCFLGIRHTKV